MVVAARALPGNPARAARPPVAASPAMACRRERDERKASASAASMFLFHSVMM
jgi:hypothetical protein